MALPYERTTSKEEGQYEPVQVFSPDTISANQTTHSTTGVLAFRVTSDGTYYINSASGAIAAVQAGTVIGVGTGVTQIVFATNQILEIMSI